MDTLAGNRGVISKYITPPLLFEGKRLTVAQPNTQPPLKTNPLAGRKCDLRVYVLATSFGGGQGCEDGRYFMFKRGLLRFCSQPYDVSDEGIENRQVRRVRDRERPTRAPTSVVLVCVV
jgi:hypothetical protein